MKFTTTTLEPRRGFSNLRINGTTREGLRFIACCFKALKSEVRLRLVFDPGCKPVSKFASDAGALAAINGGFYTLDKFRPLDWLIVGGVTITGLSNMARPCLCLSGGRAFISMPPITEHMDEVLQSGPLLLRHGRINKDYSDYQEKAGQFDADITVDRYPRSVLGICDKTYYFMTVDGRSHKSSGLFLQECAELIGKLGARDAINLDGGGSSALVVNGELLNNPRTWMYQPVSAERSVPTAILVECNIRHTS